MQFFEKTHERLYPVGRLDYLSEGLLLMTNDGELAHKLTRAASGVEKTYLVKVSGQPTEAELDHSAWWCRHRSRTARRRQGAYGAGPDKPGAAGATTRGMKWCSSKGATANCARCSARSAHFVEKIRRVGYGPLILDLEPGQGARAGSSRAGSAAQDRRRQDEAPSLQDGGHDSTGSGATG